MSKIEKVLILDENESNLLFFEMLLQDFDRDFTIFTATAGSQAEATVKSEKIQFVICAWEMSSMPGTVFIQRVRQSKARRFLPCLIFSKRMNEQEVTLTKELGFEDILGMPFDKVKARELITNILHREESVSTNEKKLRKIEDCISEGQMTEALKLFDANLTSKGEHINRAKANLAEIWLQTRHFDKVERIVEEILKSEPDHLHTLRIKAKFLSLNERHDEAIAILEQISNKSPKNIRSMLQLGSAYVDASEHDKAREIFKKVEDLDADNSELKDEQGKLAFKEGDIPLAAQLLAETECGDELARHFNNIAISKVTGGMFEEGIQTYNNAIQLLTDKTKLHLLHFNLGLAWKKKGSLDESFKYLCQSYLIEPSYDRAYAALAKVSQELKESGGEVDQELVKQVKEARGKSKT